MEARHLLYIKLDRALVIMEENFFQYKHHHTSTKAIWLELEFWTEETSELLKLSSKQNISAMERGVALGFGEAIHISSENSIITNAKKTSFLLLIKKSSPKIILLWGTRYFLGWKGFWNIYYFALWRYLILLLKFILYILLLNIMWNMRLSNNS